VKGAYPFPKSFYRAYLTRSPEVALFLLKDDCNNLLIRGVNLQKGTSHVKRMLLK
jgi:hypothetical protein